MKARPLGVVFTAMLFAATVAFAQQDTNTNNPNNSSNTSATDQNTNTSSDQNANASNPNAANTGVQGNVWMGKVTKYTQGQSLTVKTDKGKTKTFDLTKSTANIDPSIKVGSRVKVSETNNNGQQTISVEPYSGSASNASNPGNENTSAANNSGNTGTSNTGRRSRRNLPRTGSEMPLLGLIGLASLVAGTGVRFAAKKLS